MNPKLESETIKNRENRRPRCISISIVFFNRFFNAFFRFFSENMRFWVPSWVRQIERSWLDFLIFSGLGPSWGPRPFQRASKADFDIIFHGFSLIFGWILASIFERFVMFHRQVFSEKKARGGIGA